MESVARFKRNGIYVFFELLLMKCIQFFLSRKTTVSGFKSWIGWSSVHEKPLLSCRICTYALSAVGLILTQVSLHKCLLLLVSLTELPYWLAAMKNGCNQDGNGFQLKQMGPCFWRSTLGLSNNVQKLIMRCFPLERIAWHLKKRRLTIKPRLTVELNMRRTLCWWERTR